MKTWTHTDKRRLLGIQAPDTEGNLQLSLSDDGRFPHNMAIGLCEEEVAGLAAMLGKDVKVTVTVEVDE